MIGLSSMACIDCVFQKPDRGAMPIIDQQLFQGTDTVSDADWQGISRPDVSSASIASVLEQHGWEKKATAAVGLKLSPDNTSVSAAKLAFLGSWDKKIQIQARKVFQQAAEDVLLEVELPDLSVFRCREGDMWSRYVPQAGLPCRLGWSDLCFFWANQVLTCKGFLQIT